ncbi:MULTISPECIES: TetR family transcriptional regulator [unclassified Streptomyces]|uniref:TetR/AcrR family transcriptional regulator n=1 Tax=unclassified Streptomyces TaxID=2593676 RepID=UPI002E3299AC|nr:TetR family transcriptional regulator [Streptomyces sp. NBC_01460]WSS28522.1 TetR family transcriptional regulator [Streptomyces sp. NBC_01185]
MTARAASSAPRRSDATRAAILEAARERFAADGYERATIRAIARDARIDPSMVMRYYGSKEGLFAAASAFDLRLPALGALPGKHVGAVLVGHFLDRWEQDDVLTGLLKVGVTNEAGADRMRAVFAEQLGPITAGVCPDPADAPRRAALVASQILGMALARYVLRFEPAVTMSREEVVGWLAPTVQRYLTAEQP